MITESPSSLFTSLFRSHPAAVTVVTGVDGDRIAGATMTSVSSVSRTPPLVSLNLSRHVSAFDVLSRAECLGIHFLDEAHDSIASSFAASGVDRFAGRHVRRGETGAPVLEGVARVLEVVVINRVEAGDSVLLVAEVRAGTNSDGGRPLLYQAGRFRRLAS
jgi:flavin reductase (DIM6/NTAB) family NADH-FMN oxidoreductase RutF